MDLNKKKLYICLQKKLKLCQKEHFNHPIERERTNMVLWKECLTKMDKGFYQEEERKEERDSLFLMKLAINKCQ